jgi:Spy/CpxP family protein refolding chaperone
MLLGTTLRAAHQLNLSAEQQSQIKTILQNAHAQAKANRAANAVDMAVIGNPADPNYATALQTMKTNAANRVQAESELQAQIYNVLTPQQKTQLPSVLASMKAKQEAQHAAWAQKHSSSLQ